MPLYKLVCNTCGGSQDQFMSYRKMKARSGSIPCSDDCAGALSYSPAIGATIGPTSTQRSSGFKTRTDKWSGITTHDYGCDFCGHVEEVSIDFNRGETVSARPCPTQHKQTAGPADEGGDGWVDCTGTMRVIRSVSIERFGEIFTIDGGYYDRGLGVHVKSKQHRLETAKRMGLEPVDGDIDVRGHGKKMQSEHDHDMGEYAKIKDRFENHPAFAETRRLADMGAFDEDDADGADIDIRF